MKPIIILLFCVISFSDSSLGQAIKETIIVDLKAKIGLDGVHRRTYPVNANKPIMEYKGIPEYISSPSIGHFIFQRDQYICEMYKKGYYTKTEYLDKISRYNLDTTKLYYEGFVKCYVGILTGIFNNRKVIIADANNNLDFSDDMMSAYDISTSSRNYDEDSLNLLPAINVNYESVLNKKIVKKHGFIKIKPYDHAYTNISDDDSFIYVMPFEHKIGEFTLNGEVYKLLLTYALNSIEGRFNIFSTKIQLNGLEYEKNSWMEANTPFKINSDRFMLDSCSSDGNNLYISYYGFEKVSIGWQVGDKLPENFVRVIDSLHHNKKRYTILDFWGSWCSPCIENIPSLKNFYDTYRNNRINLISISCEKNNEGEIKAKRIIEDNKIEWPQLFERLPNGKFHREMNIESFPAILVINSDNKIIKREIGIKGIDNIVKMIDAETKKN